MATRTLGSRYLLEQQIGQGGMGVVWRGRDKISGAPFAIKVLRSEYSADPDAVTRFVRERTVLMKFRHPAVVSVHDMIVEGDQLALVMDLVEGGDLNAYRQRSGGRLPWPETTRIGAQICDGLDAAHRAGIIHRDLKPANVLLAGGQVRLADFGVARIVGDQSATTTGIVLGTAHYLAPEMLTGGQPSPASDMYALGITLYEVLAGKPPFTGHVGAIMHDHIATAPARIPGLPDPLWELVSACLSKQPEARPAAAAMSRALRDPALAAPPPAAQAAPRDVALATSPPAALAAGPFGGLPAAPAMPAGPPAPRAAQPAVAGAGLPPRRGKEAKRSAMIIAAAGVAALLCVLAGVAALTHLGPFGHGHKTVAGGPTVTADGVTAPTPGASGGSGAASSRAGSKSGKRISPRSSPSSSPSASPSASSRSSKPSPSSPARSSSSSRSTTYGPELIVNGSFDSDTLTGWRSNGVGLVTGGGPGGANAVKLQGADEAGVFQAVYGLAPGTTYLVTGWGEAAGGDVRIGVGDTDDSHEVGGSVTSSSWTKVSITYTLATDQTSVNVFCVQGGPYIGYCADLTFQQVKKS
jgi:serine/threonine-protein kinase